jgi:hypothetical protein
MWRAAALLMTACAGFQRVPLKSDVVRIADGRFMGPLEIPVPRRAEHDGHDFELSVTLRTRCAPALTLAFPDGETELLGENDRAWQELLERRAKQEPSLAAGAPPAATTPYGHWERTTVETWSGQLAFERQRAQRCGEVREYRAKHLNAFDESGALTLWATVPQELADAELRYEIVERVPTRPPETAPVPASEPRATAAAEPPRPRPPVPQPRREDPGNPETPGARWQSGDWVWVEGQGEWVWVSGYWLAPETQPALKVENPGAAPNEGCRWANGHWEWRPHEGHWEWMPGHWDAPPPLVEQKGASPGEGSTWQVGSWTWGHGKFDWHPGRWGKPALKVEVVPPPPFAGARWIAGDWLDLDGTWKWSPGFFEGTQRPPPPKPETPPERPSADAVWLLGYWRWDAAKREHFWVPGHWERPPGENYVWVADQPGIRGHWELRVKVIVK